MEDFISLKDDGAVKKKIIIEGEGESPKEGDFVVVNYKLCSLEGKIHGEGSDEIFEIGKRKFTISFDIAVLSMKKGEKATIISTPKFAFGIIGATPGIPPNTGILWEIELLKFGTKEEIYIYNI